ncbi:MAG: L-threonylcarbamoyladenylate synthase [Myxococcota bacterium]
MVDPTNPDPRVLQQAAQVLRRGGLVAFPTETVYGLGARALDQAAVQRIYAAKGRPGWNPLIAHVLDAHMAQRDVVSSWPPLAETLARAFWPGPLTLVLPRQDRVPPNVSAGLPSVAVRAPAHPVARELIRLLDEPVAAPSANRFMAISPTTADHVEKGLGEAVDILLDGGPANVGVESTVVDLTSSPPRVLRPGGITLDALRAAAPQVTFITAAEVVDGEARASPGQVRKHYAPKAHVILVPHGDVGGWRSALATAAQPVGTLSFTLQSSAPTVVHLPLDPVAAQAALYGALHQLEDAGCATVVVEEPPAGPDWDAVRDRLSRAGA